MHTVSIAVLESDVDDAQLVLGSNGPSVIFYFQLETDVVPRI